jgi:hypothetical protein
VIGTHRPATHTSSQRHETEQLAAEQK